MHDKDAIYRIIGYSFQDDNLLKDALTAAGANEDNYEGNRTLAQVGKMFVNLMSVKMGYSSGAKPGTCSSLEATTMSLIKLRAMHGAESSVFWSEPLRQNCRSNRAGLMYVIQPKTGSTGTQGS